MNLYSHAKKKPSKGPPLHKNLLSSFNLLLPLMVFLCYISFVNVAPRLSSSHSAPSTGKEHQQLLCSPFFCESSLSFHFHANVSLLGFFLSLCVSYLKRPAGFLMLLGPLPPPIIRLRKFGPAGTISFGPTPPNIYYKYTHTKVSVITWSITFDVKFWWKPNLYHWKAYFHTYNFHVHH